MYWREEEVEGYIRYPSEGNAEELGSPIYSVAKGELEHAEIIMGIVEELEEKGSTTHRSDRTMHANTTRSRPAKSNLLTKSSMSGSTR